MDLNNRLYKAILRGLNEALTRFDLDDFDFNDEVKMLDIKLNKISATKKSMHKLANIEINNLLKKLIETDKLSKNINKVNKLISQGAIYKVSNENIKSIIEKYINLKGNECNLNWIDTSDVTVMSFMFNNSKFTGDISKWDTSNVTDMNSMFERSLFNGDISNWNTSNVTDMSFMFNNSKFTGDISKWDTSNVTDMKVMFNKSKFTGDISNWNTSKVTNMRSLFSGSQFNGDISKWDTSNVTNMWSMFEGSLFTGDISNWNTSNVTDMRHMFDECPIPEENKPK